MMRIIVLLGLSMALCHSAWADITVMHWQTDNGAQVDFVPAHDLPIVDMAVSFKAGSAYDGSHWGLANMVASTVDTGAAGQDELQIATLFDQLGVGYDASVGRDQAVFTLRSLNQPNSLWQAALQLGNLLSHATFPDQPWQRVRAEQLVNLKLASQQPDVVARWRLYAALYGKHPYAHPVDGTRETVQGLTPALAKQFYQRYYVAHNALITIVGDVTEAQARKLSALISSAMSVGKSAPALPAVVPLSQSITIRVLFPSKQTTIMMAALGAKAADPAAIALKLGNYSLGGAGLTSLLSKQVREHHGLVYGVGSGFVGYACKGLFLVTAQTRNSSVSQATNLIQQTITDYLAKGPDAKQLTAAKDFVNGAFPVSLGSNTALLNVVSRWRFYGLPQDYLQTYLQRVDRTTLPAVKQALKQTVNWGKHVTVIVGGGQ